ncbi:MAG: aldo/keto reductase [Rhodobacterales bacterium RIFCSPHIGHO2_02_FULL_62_130]|nr:MAG: aldo/keto reductase [Rhodobacterales bacterium RIFCSPHIGHO2_02_FULL_62_130]OHC55915.1 MAG: aldo/keto reductase [Rhodobacterales bacterium RIFCSPHIGHO2_12_FULL_62_75]HCY99993.1 aldo/keto reductase [Rhodobacter sp.]
MSVSRITLRPGHEISRVIRGGWQLAGGHGPVDRAATIEDMIAFAEAGITTFDCADIYTGVEELIGEFRAAYGNRHGAQALAGIKVHTKLVPDLARLATVDRAYVRGIVETSLKRLQMERLDLVQFHWWDYTVPRYLEAIGWLNEMRAEGKVAHVGGTNFDTATSLEIISSGVPLVSMQVQYSLIDLRAERLLAQAALANDMGLLCYGTVAGGFLGDRWLGQPEPQHPLENRSLTKYKLIIDDFGGWDLFQSLLQTLRSIADRHGSDIATVASAAMLNRPAVAAVIVGARNRSHLPRNVAISELALTPQDLAEIAAIQAEGNIPEGDTYTLERDRHGRHGNIIKYNLNAAS